ncbi:hypothetical protein NS2_00950 [Nocardia seriolae NBRC 15557]|nr:hypothetical protein NS2_00950 [Nocardia seriolae NBRC 15557]
MRDAVGRVVRVHRHERRTGLGHRPLGEVRVIRTRHRDGDQVLGADAALDEQARQAVRAGIQLAVGQTRPLEHDRGRGRVDGDGVGDELRQRARRDGGQTETGHQIRALTRIQDVDRADTDLRVGGDGFQHPHPPLREPGRGGLVEQVGGVGERQRHAGVLLRQCELEIEAGDVLVEIQCRDGQPRQFQAGAVQVLERQHDLEQRVAGLRALGREQFHQPLERHVGIAEGVEVGVPHAIQQIGERLARLDPGAQHQGVDEHADQVVQRGFATTGDRGADGDVIATGEPRQQHREGAVHDHEQRRTALAGNLFQLADQLRRQRPLQRSAAVRGNGRARPVGGQRQLVRHAAEHALPVGDLPGHDRGRILFRAQHFALPHGEVGVLHGQRGPAGHRALVAGGVGQHDVTGQRRHGEAVTGDVVDDDHQHVLGGVLAADPEQAGAQRNLFGHIEAERGERGHGGGQIRRGDGDRAQVEGDLLGRDDHLHRGAAVLRVAGAQRLVAADHVGDREFQCGGVEFAGEADGQRQVVGRRGGVVLVEEPHALLRERQRHQRARRAGARHQLGARSAVGVRFDAGRERLDGGGLEQGADRDGGVEGRADAGRDAGGDERVTAQVEEVVVQADPLESEDLGEDARDGFLDRRLRRAEGARLHGRGREGATVQLAVDGQRDSVQHHDGGRDHVGRQQLGRSVADGVHGGRDAVLGHHVGHDPLIARLVLAHDDRRLRDAGLRQHRGLDLTELDTETADLHLVVGAAQVFELAEAVPAGHVTRAVQPLARDSERAGHEAGRGQIRATEIAARQLRSGHVHFARDTDRHRVQPVVEDVHAQTRDGTADHRTGGGGNGVGIEHAHGHVHRGLGDAVHVDQVRRGIAVAGNPIREAAQLERLTAEDHVAQRQGLLVTRGGGDAVGLGELVERRRRLVEHRDAFAAQQFQELLRRARHVVVDDHELAAVEQRAPQLPDREVEGVGVEQRPHVVVPEAELAIGVGHEPHDVPMRDRHALGATGGAGGVDDVGDVVRAQRGAAVGIGDGRVGRVLDIPGLQRETVQQHGVQLGGRSASPRLLDLHRRVGDHAGGPRVREHVGDAIGRVARIDRHVARTGLDHGQQRDDQIRRARQQHRHQRLRPRALADQPARQHIRAPVELGVGQLLVAEAHRDPLRVRGHGQVEQARQGGVGVDERARHRGKRVGQSLGGPAQRGQRRRLGRDARNAFGHTAFGLGDRRAGDPGQRDDVLARGDPVLGHIVALTLAQQVDIADERGRILGHRTQDAHQALGEGGHGLDIEQIGRVVPGQAQ